MYVLIGKTGQGQLVALSRRGGGGPQKGCKSAALPPLRKVIIKFEGNPLCCQLAFRTPLTISLSFALLRRMGGQSHQEEGRKVRLR